ncbi:MAG: response regulator transcription factor [Candidatus Delongbacteria bacterium]|jgi:two-component system alkaline phosphatase synthesis response regulator PhoP|nr:response regulator transcription factor [Candidatus Delongbacteria bacterium]
MDNALKILLVEDEIDISEIIKINLETQGYSIDTAISAEDALKMSLETYDLFIFDIMLENMTGIELAKIIKSNNNIQNTPIIFLTAKNTEENKLDGFEVGADDYITKPFSVKEFIARVKAVLKRSYAKTSITNEKIILDESRKIAIVNGFDVTLTKKEYLLLETLIQNKKQLFSRNQLLDIVWDDDGSVTDRAVDVMIRRLRKKLGDQGVSIKTRSGLGYTFDPS